MERLTRTINTVREDVDLQAALDKLSAYEDAEERGKLISIPTDAYYIRGNVVNKGPVLAVKYRNILTGKLTDPDFELVYTIDTGTSISFKGILGIDVFNSRKEAEVKIISAHK